LSESNPVADHAGPAFADFLAGELAAEDSRRDSLEKRGLALVTVAGSLVTLLFALQAVFLRPSGRSSLPGLSVGSLLVGLVALVATAGCAVATNVPRMVRLIDPDGFLATAKERWESPADDAVRSVLATRVEQLRASQQGNDRRGMLLLTGMLALAIAVLALALAVMASALDS
jgi:hypothetical protein